MEKPSVAYVKKPLSTKNMLRITTKTFTFLKKFRVLLQDATRLLLVQNIWSLTSIANTKINNAGWLLDDQIHSLVAKLLDSKDELIKTRILRILASCVLKNSFNLDRKQRLITTQASKFQDNLGQQKTLSWFVTSSRIPRLFPMLCIFPYGQWQVLLNAQNNQIILVVITHLINYGTLFIF